MSDGAFQIAATGGPEVLTWVERDPGAPGPDEIRVRHEAIGVNYIDVYHRSGVYPLPLPSGLGVEGAGIVEAVGPNVRHIAPGDRIGYLGGPPGAYSTVRIVPAARVVKLPDDIPFDVAAALLFKGLTAFYLVHKVHAAKPGDRILLHAAAGGVGRIAASWLKHLGATTIGIVGSQEKATVAAAAGCDHVIVNADGTFAADVRAIAPEGVDVVYDSVGRTTFAASLDTLRPRGLMVSFGTASGPIPQNDGGIFGAKGSLFFTRCSIAHYMATRAQIEEGAAALFALLSSGVLGAGDAARYPLADAARAHADLEARRTTGSLLLIP